jgi:hypothetical protein
VLFLCPEERNFLIIAFANFNLNPREKMPKRQQRPAASH